MKAVTVTLNIILLIGVSILVSMFGLKYYECHHMGNQNGIVVSWSPVNGCTTSVLGTDVRLDR